MNKLLIALALTLGTVAVYPYQNTTINPDPTVNTDPCAKATGIWASIAGPRPGATALIPAGTAYQIDQEPCITAKAQVNVPATYNQLGILRLGVDQTIKIISPTGVTYVTIPASGKN